MVCKEGESITDQEAGQVKHPLQGLGKSQISSCTMLFLTYLETTFLSLEVFFCVSLGHLETASDYYWLPWWLRR